MRGTVSIVGFAAAVILVATPPAGAQEDVAGSADHPIITRFEGSVIIGYVQREFDEYTAALGRADERVGNSFSPPAFAKSLALEGKITRILYRVPEGRSSLEVFRNYTAALAKDRFETLFECSADACGRVFYERSGGFFGVGRSYSVRDLFVGRPDVERYVAAKLARSEGDAYVFVYVLETDTSMTGTFVHLDVVEGKAMGTGLVTANAAALAADISQSGHVALYGIFFDTGSATITPASDAAIAEISTLLRENAAMRLHIVGHTDTEGTFDFNMDLSRRRAEAVMQTLVSKHTIAAARLQASGVGYLAPVASNRTEDGRAKNRRVELVEIF
ncbi:MAG: DUF4892 domain-containing protein [Acidobacteria bacterium]|nr:DUF4892 domain-containing protein [Acidobacteriota bacterium]